MRYIGIIILLVVLSSACRSDHCNRTFRKDFNLSILPIWEKQTEMNLGYRKNDTLISLFKSATRDGVSFFERELFLRNVLTLRELKGYKFDSLVVIEVNTSGEVHLRRKYLLASCGKKTTIIKFQLTFEKWNFIQVHDAEASDVIEALKSILDRSSNKAYWGGNVNDLVVVSKFQDDGRILVEVFDTLSEKQYLALGIVAE